MIETKQGEFESFATLRKAYVDTREGKTLGIEPYTRAHTFEPQKLHLSKLGACPRQQMYDILGTEKKRESASRQANDALMFTIGYFVHYLTYAALDWGGILESFEEPIEGLEEPWTGRYDAIINITGEQHLWSGKTTRPNAFKGNYRYSYPKLSHKLQEGGYLGYLDGVAGSVIEYIDRGGANSPLTYYVSSKHAVNPARLYMQRIEECYEALPELPDMRPRELTPHYRKRTNLNAYDLDYINEEYCWECGWCPYLYGRQDKKTKVWQIAGASPCKPDMRPPEKVGWHSGKIWHYKSDDVIGWAENQIASYFVEDEE